MLKKLIICLGHPTRIGLYLNEKMWKSILELLLVAFIITIPYTVSLSLQKELSNQSVTNTVTFFNNYSEECDLEIKDGVLTGKNEILMAGYEAYVFFNPNNKTLDATYRSMPLLEFSKNKLILTFMGIKVYEKAYTDLAYNELSIKKMTMNDYNEISKLNEIFNDVFVSVRGRWVVANSTFMLVQAFVLALLSSLVLGLFSSFVNIGVPFKYRFKLALDSQFISLICILLSLLFSASWLEYVGVILSACYLISALSKIIRISIPKIGEER